MKVLIVFFAVLSLLPLRADPLTQADVEELRERLKAIQEGANGVVDARFKSAVEAYRTAIASDDAAIALYEKCIEKVNFTDQQRKTQDFRNWKRDNEDRLKNPAFKQALRHQLNWLLVTLKAASRPEEVASLAPEANEVLNAVFAHIREIAPEAKLLEAPVTSSVFARAYELGPLKLENWPSSPMQVGEIYQTIIMPSLRRADKIPALTAAWDSRIKMEGAKVEFLSGKVEAVSALSTHETRSPEMVRFIEEIVPDLVWKKEMDLFKAGDQRASALRMINHIKTNLTHANATEWINQFQEVITPPVKKVADPQ
jgi:hypothetical protein